MDLFIPEEVQDVIFYKRFPMDYGRETAHLSLAEHGAFTLLLDTYYSTGRPLPGPIAALTRLCRASTSAERKAVESVAEQFFPICEDGLRHHEQTDRDLVDYNQRVEFNRRVGGLGGRPRRSEGNPDANPNANPDGIPDANPNGYPEETLLQKSEVRSQKSEVKKEKSVGTAFAVPARPQGEKPNSSDARPTIEDVQAYCAERGNRIDPQQWFDHYTANGWKVGKNPMRDWRAAIRTWEKNGFTRTPKAVDPATFDYSALKD